MATNTTTRQEWYPDGQLKEYALYEGTQPANGWSYKLYHPNGQLQQQNCYSHGQLIELQTFDTDGNKIAHTIWNHRLQQMVNRPTVTPAKQTQRPNIASGCMTIYNIAEIMSLIAELIEAPDRSDEMLKAHDHYYGYTNDEGKEQEKVWEDNAESEQWVIKGKKGWFSVLFERHEGYLFYHIHTPHASDYERARQLVEQAQNRNRLYRYFSEDELTKRAIETGKPILYYIAPYNNRNSLEMELAIWATEPVYTLLDNNYILSIHRVDTASGHWPTGTSFLTTLPNWENTVREVQQGNVFYILHAQKPGMIPLIKNPTATELEMFLDKHRYP